VQPDSTFALSEPPSADVVRAKPASSPCLQRAPTTAPATAHHPSEIGGHFERTWSRPPVKAEPSASHTKILIAVRPLGAEHQHGPSEGSCFSASLASGR